MGKSKHRAVWDWLRGCERVKKLFFSFGTEGNAATVIVPSDSLVEEYVSGAQARTYTVQLTRFLPVSFDANDTSNIDMLEDIDAIAEWIDARGKAGDFPEFPEGCTVSEIRAYASMSGYEIAQNGVYARYILPFTIYYTKE